MINCCTHPGSCPSNRKKEKNGCSQGILPCCGCVIHTYGYRVSQWLERDCISQHQQDRSSHGPEVRITSFREYLPLVSTAIHHLMAGKCQHVAKGAPHQLAMGGWEHVTLLDSGSFLHNVFLFLFYCYTLATHTF